MINCGSLIPEVWYAGIISLEINVSDPRGPSSVPPIFSSVYKRKCTDFKQAGDRYKRKLCRDMQKPSFFEEQPSVSMVENITITQFVFVGT